MAVRIKDVSRWLMLGVLVYAPWAFGCTRTWAINLLILLLGSTLALWFVSAVLQKRMPKVPSVLAVLCFLLIGYAWWMVANAKFTYDLGTWTFHPRTAVASDAPGSIDYNRSWASALRVSALLGALCFITDMCRTVRWRKRLIWTMAITGVSIAFFGLTQRMLGASSIFWQARDTGNTFFATYRYHSNAGAFLNLVWPLAAIGWVTAWRRAVDPRRTVLWGAAVLLCFCGLVVSGARAASANAVFLLALWGVWLGWQIRCGRLPAPARPTVIVGGTLLVLLVVSVAAMAGLDVSARRWGKTEELFSATNPRLLVDYICLKMIPEAGWFGFGPGTFRIAFPYYTHEIGDSVSGVWLYAHQDYLQTFIEWGYVGGVLWAALLIGGLVNASRSARMTGVDTPFRDRTLHFALATALGGALLHALVDFPLQIASIQLYFLALLAFCWQGSTVPSSQIVPLNSTG